MLETSKVGCCRHSACMGRTEHATIAQVEEIRQLNALLGLDQGQGSFGLRLRSVGDLATLSPAQQDTVRRIWARMSSLVAIVAGLCIQVLRLQGPDVASLVAATYDRCAPGVHARAHARVLPSCTQQAIRHALGIRSLRARHAAPWCSSSSTSWPCPTMCLRQPGSEWLASAHTHRLACRCSSLRGWKDPAKWLAIARDLQLSPDQVAAMGEARQRSLQGLKRCTLPSCSAAGGSWQLQHMSLHDVGSLKWPALLRGGSALLLPKLPAVHAAGHLWNDKAARDSYEV